MSPKTQIVCYLEYELLLRLDAFVRGRKQSRNEVITAAIKRLLEAEERDEVQPDGDG